MIRYLEVGPAVVADMFEVVEFFVSTWKASFVAVGEWVAAARPALAWVAAAGRGQTPAAVAAVAARAVLAVVR